MVENLKYVGKKRLSPPKKLSITICKISHIFVASLPLLDVINEWLQFIYLWKKSE